MNLRSRLGGIATGDQAIFSEPPPCSFDRVGGFPNQPLMEDPSKLSARLRFPCSAPGLPAGPVVTSARRWHRTAFSRDRFLTMWGCELAYACGVPAQAFGTVSTD